MALDIYSPAVLNRVVQDLKADSVSFLLDTFFPEISVSNQEEIFFDVLSGKPRLAPFVSPLVEGQIVQSNGYATKSFKPAYVKDKRLLEDGKPIRRRAGQPIAVGIDPMDGRLAQIATESEDQIAMINRRLEWMASEVLRTGAVTVSGEKYPTTVVDFGRDAGLTVTLTTTARWNDSAPTPLEDLETWAGLVRTASGATPTDVVMSQDTWAAFRKNDDVKELLDQGSNLSPRSNADLGPRAFEMGATLVAQIGAFRIWVYADSYISDAGASANYIPSGYLLMASAQLEGVRHFGAIKDETAGFQALDYYQKSWTQPDPAGRYLMLQSAPLVVPYRVNATLSAKVF
jgi:hypothetical protein